MADWPYNFLKAPSAPLYFFDGERVPKIRNFLVEVFQKFLKIFLACFSKIGSLGSSK